MKSKWQSIWRAVRQLKDCPNVDRQKFLINGDTVAFQALHLKYTWFNPPPCRVLDARVLRCAKREHDVLTIAAVCRARRQLVRENRIAGS